MRRCGGLTAGGPAPHNGRVQRVRTVSLRTWVAVAVLAAASGLVIAWTQRAPIAESAIRGWLADRDIDGRYAVERLEPERAVLRDVVLAGGAFSAARVEVRLAGWPFAPRPVAIALDRPVLRAQIDDAGLTLGGLERLVPTDTDPDAPLPDIDVQMRDGRLVLTTPAGEMRAGLRSSGRLAGGFRGVATLVPAPLEGAGCRASAVGGTLILTTAIRRIRVAGQGPLGGLVCEGGAAARGGWALAAATDPGGRRVTGSGSLALTGVRAAGFAAARLVAGVGADGTREALGGHWRLTVQGPRGAGGSVTTLIADGRYAARPGMGEIGTDWTLRGTGVALPPLALPAAAAGIERALRPRGGFSVEAAGSAGWRGGATTAQLNRLELRAATGARFEAAGRPLAQVGPSDWRISGVATASGGGLPPLRLSAEGLTANAGRAALTLGSVRIAGAQLSADADIRRAAGGWRAAGSIRASGRLSGWSVGPSVASGAVLIADALGDIRADGCLDIRLGAATRDDLRLDPMAARLCPDARRPLVFGLGAPRGALTVAPVRLSATAGGMRIGGIFGARVAFDGGVVAEGTIAQVAASGAALPVRLAAGEGRWRWRDGAFELAAARARLTDAAADPRFEPLTVAAVTGRLANGRITAAGELRLAKGVRLLGFTAAHDLASGMGEAALATGELVFGDRLQPDEISTAFRGVVANVEGAVSGAGEVRWTPEGVTSRGHAETAKLDLATAALGPVGGVSGRIEFDDLIAVTTPPGQQLRIASINPGVLVENGVVTFRMLGPTRVAVAGADWPFVGGRLTLRPTEIAADEPVRRFTLDVEGADAAQFLARFDIPNLNVTGIFDGQMPLVFDGPSGRIEKGLLVARPPGGVIQYAGEVGADAMGAGGRLAFDALKRLRYRSLGLAFDGALDGEIVTAIRFTGTNEAPVAPAAGVPVRASGLPFKFNVTVRAPFRQLLGAAASFGDVRETIRAGAAAEGAPPAPPDPAATRPDK